MSGQLKYTLVVRHPETLEAVALLAGSELPKWATEDIVHPGNVESGKAKSKDADADADKTEKVTKAETEDKGYAGQKPADLAAEAEKRKLEVTGTGKDGNVVKADLVAALEADDAANSGA